MMLLPSVRSSRRSGALSSLRMLLAESAFGVLSFSMVSFHVPYPNGWLTNITPGNKLAWSERPLPFGEILNTEIDLARESGKKRPDIVRVLIRKTAMVVLEPVNQWINGKCEANSDVQQGMTFLNHLISQSLRLDPANVCLKRSFFRPTGQTTILPGGLNCRKGIFMSVRGGDQKLTVNVDVATAVFWAAGSLLSVIQKYITSKY